MPDPTKRRSLEETWRLLESDDVAMPRKADGSPFVSPKMPSYDDSDPLGFCYFRTRLQSADLSNLCLPRTFFGRSSFEGVSFRNTNLSESRMCWNDFINVDFSDADLTGCDLRASNYSGCNFAGAILTGADLRCSSYEDCNFAGAVLVDAVSDRPSADMRGLLESLTEEQKALMRWQEAPGEVPGGG
jgi:BTB/POZ domain-containing protein KCTD9